MPSAASCTVPVATTACMNSYRAATDALARRSRGCTRAFAAQALLKRGRKSSPAKARAPSPRARSLQVQAEAADKGRYCGSSRFSASSDIQEGLEKEQQGHAFALSSTAGASFPLTPGFFHILGLRDRRKQKACLRSQGSLRRSWTFRHARQLRRYGRGF